MYVLDVQVREAILETVPLDCVSVFYGSATVACQETWTWDRPMKLQETRREIKITTLDLLCHF